MSCCTREAREPQASKQALGEDAHDLWQRREKVLERARADCTGYLVYLFENDEGKGETESPFLLSEYAEEESPMPH